MDHDDDTLIDDLIQTNPEFRAIVEKSKAVPHKPFVARGREFWRRLIAKLGPKELPLGARGEAYAARFLKKQGYKLIVRNRREKKGEIDLIVADKEFLVFVEVRTRTSADFMTPEASIRADKRQTVQRTVRRLIRKHKTAGLRPRIDVVAIIWPAGAKQPTDVRHHKGAIRVGAWGSRDS